MPALVATQKGLLNPGSTHDGLAEVVHPMVPHGAHVTVAVLLEEVVVVTAVLVTDVELTTLQPANVGADTRQLR